MQDSHHPPRIPAAPNLKPPAPVHDEPIELVEDLLEEMPADTPGPFKSKIKAFGTEAARKEQQFKRPTNVTGFGATRVKSFHGKYSDQGVEHLDDMINAWLDEHAEVEVKFVTSTVHVFEGKIREPALVLNLWY